MKLGLVLFALLAVSTSVAGPPKPPQGEISTWVLLKLTEAGCTVRSDPTAMSGMQIRIRDSLTAEQFESITDQTLFLATDCNTRQAMAEAALLEQASGARIKFTPLRVDRNAAVYDVIGEGVSALLALTPLGDHSGVAVITMADLHR